MGHHSRSAMQRLTGLWAADGTEAQLSVRLRTQYRMHDSVCNLIDMCFYGKHVRS
jgi:hypothetical protein